MIEQASVGAKRWSLIVAIVLVCGIAFLFGLGRLALVGPDEPRYAEVAREMFATGDYISTRLCGCTWFEKPVLLYWLQAISYGLVGVNEVGARLPAAAVALATVLMMFIGLRRLLTPRTAAIIALVLATMAIFLVYARAAATDMMLAGTITLSLLFGYLATLDRERIAPAYLWIGAAGTGLTLLAKGLVGIVLVILIFGVYLIVTRRLRSLRWKHALIALLIILFVAAIWYVPVISRHGWDFIQQFFIEHHFQRYATNRYNHPAPVYFFVVITLLGAMPWTFFLIPAVSNLSRLNPRGEHRDALLLFSWIWVIVTVLFFSVSQSKLPGYLLPAFPGLAIILGCEIDRSLKGDRQRSLRVAEWLTVFAALAVGIGFIAYLRRMGVNPHGWVLGLSLMPAALAVVTTAALAAGKRQAPFFGVTGLTLAVVMVSVTILFPVVNETKSLKRLSVEVSNELDPNEKIAFFLMKEYAPVFYCQGRVLCKPGMGSVVNAMDTGTIIRLLESEQSIVVFTTTDWIRALEDERSLTIEPIGEQGKARAMRVRLREGAASL